MSAASDRSPEDVRTPDPRFSAPSGLRAAVVRHDGEPDRCTVYPEDADDVALVTTWLSVDADCLVALDDAR
ncbi:MULTISPECIES: DUF7511 domain-containing protein [Halobaculum]|uniref:DUF7511 domain-containing protein n=2 Tax=Halobaculum TaxID=43927 RepID=A0A8T8WCD3_9EURY|nr:MULTISPECIES: hypothetical protein [Halobaculum]QZP37413.1 hypothetical protein K6T50_14225 [Halobaculum magnesiiphilum]QZY02423.1 hypothetical protein K6T36_14170 [Halobaculum roseum]